MSRVDVVRAWLRRPYAVVLAAAVAVAALGVFSLAWYVPAFGGPVLGVSYSVGYNNLVAVAGLLAGAVLAFVAGVLARRSRRAEAGGTEEAEDRTTGGAAGAEAAPGSGEGPPARDVWLLAVAVAVFYVGSLLLTRSYPILENAFFFDRIAQGLAGYRPGTDFDFPYGQLMLYLPVAASWLAVKAGLSAPIGYFAVNGAVHVGGVVLLGWVLGALGVSRSRARALFWAIGIYGGLSSVVGLNYSLARFLAPLACLLLLARAARHQRTRGTLGAVLVAVTALVLTALNVLLSPEVGAAFAVAGVVLLASGGRLRDPDARTAFVAYAAALGVGVAFVGATALRVIGIFAKGAFAFPVLPSPFNLLYVVTALGVAYAAGLLLGNVEGADDAGAEGRPPFLALVVLGLAFVPSALGRADIGHVFFNGLPLLLAAAVAFERLAPASSAKPTGHSGGTVAFRAWAGAVALFFTGGMLLYSIFGIVPGVLTAAVMANSLPRGTVSSLAWALGMTPEKAEAAYDAWGRNGLSAEAISALMEMESAAMPLGVADPIGFEYAVRGKLRPTHGDANGPADDEQLRLLEADVARAKWVLIPNGTWGRVQAAAASAGSTPTELPLVEGAEWNLLLEFPVRLQMRRAPYDGYSRFAAAMLERFEYFGVDGPYVVLKRTQP